MTLHVLTLEESLAPHEKMCKEQYQLSLRFHSSHYQTDNVENEEGNLELIQMPVWKDN